MVTGSERIKSCKKIFWKKYNCKHYTEYYYGAIPKILVNQGSITANSGGGVLRWMVAQVPNNCDSYDYIQINGNSESSYIFDPLRVESNKRHCMFFGSNSNHSFTLYKSKLSPGKLFVENLNIPNSTVEVTENNMTIDDWNNIFLFYEKNESDTHSVVGVQSFNKTSNETVYSNFWRTSERVIEVKKIPFEYNAKFGYNSIELDNETFTYILFPDGNQVFATFINTQDIFFDNGQKLNEVLTINNNTYIGLKPKNPVQLEFYVTETNNECETVDAMINGADKQAVFDSSNLGSTGNIVSF
ncbi:hypothetical protein TVAG_071010 [Trichomonas vaginalis G3]|uniref:Uncharacterized protein n=1 Tax=Trichomonas vaginalis (strain ATCC PRA-98 / G3) TaxID=412133 RepID=A2D804_TRIV3|nr:hypothetical protein TVAG_071010 [Trichomonas vaginalis G3]|eukprot:XP_001584423.1 hypothetical protein [Trichomonas vaginalis G3]